MKMRNAFTSVLSVLLVLGLVNPALAGSGTLAVTPGSGSTLKMGTDGSSNLFSNGAICDGAACAVLAAVKAASTAPAATDPALVVTISPNTNATLSVADSTVVAAIAAAALTPGAGLIGGTSTGRSTTVTTGGTAQTIAGGTPTNGFEVCNPSATEDAWISDSGTAAANAAGSYRVPLNGGCYSPPTGSKPIGGLSVIAATTGHALTIRTW